MQHRIVPRILAVVLLADHCLAQDSAQTCAQFELDGLSKIMPPGVHASCVHKGSLYIGGVFNELAGKLGQVQNFARWDLSAGKWEALPPIGNNITLQWAETNRGQEASFFSAVMALACPEQEDFIYVGGYFTAVGHNVTMNHFARFDTRTRQFSPLRRAGAGAGNSAMDKSTDMIGFHSSLTNRSMVTSIECVDAAHCTTMFVGGFFDSAAGVNASSVVRVRVPQSGNATEVWEAGVMVEPLMPAASALAGDAAANGTVGGVVYALLPLSAQRLLIGGAFMSAGGATSASMLVEWREDGGYGCIKSSLAAATSLTAKNCTLPYVCCAALSGPVYSLVSLGSTASNAGNDGNAGSRVLVGGGFEISAPTAAFSKNIALVQVAANASVVAPLQPQGVNAVAWGLDSDVLAMRCVHVTANRCTGYILGGRFTQLFAYRPRFNDAHELLDLETEMVRTAPFGLLYVSVLWDATGAAAPRHVPHSMFSPNVTKRATAMSARVNSICPTTQATLHTAAPKLAVPLPDLFYGGDLPTVGNVASVHLAKFTNATAQDSDVAASQRPSTLPAMAPPANGSWPALPKDARVGALSICPTNAVCPKPGVVVKCPSRWGLSCPAGNDVLEIQPCPEGYYCAQPSEMKLCPTGSVCPAGSSNPTACSVLELPGCRATGLARPKKGWSMALYSVLLVILLLALRYALIRALRLRNSRRSKVALAHPPQDSSVTPRNDDAQLKQPLLECAEGSEISEEDSHDSAAGITDSYSNGDPTAQGQTWAPVELRGSLAQEQYRAGCFDGMRSAAGTDSEGSVMQRDRRRGDQEDMDQLVHLMAPTSANAEVLSTTSQSPSTRASTVSNSGEAVVAKQLPLRPVLDSSSNFVGDDAALDTAHVNEIAHSDRIELEARGLGVTLPDGRRVLDGTSACIPSGRVTAVMGPSGAGKTTFLNALSNRITPGGASGMRGNVEGTVFINGHPASVSSIKELVGFVPQEDTMLRNLTVKENLFFCAQLRAPTKAGEPRKMRWLRTQQLVDGVLRSMSLHHIRHQLIGDEMQRGISGGQRKRVNVAMELMGQPTLLFLDEPTSGLDSTAAVALVHNLKRFADAGMSIAMVIHQPRFEVFCMFDQLILLEKGGRTAFCGSPQQASDYFSMIGYAVPFRSNPADFFMDVISSEPRVHAGLVGAAGAAAAEQVGLSACWKLYEAGNSSPLSKSTDITPTPAATVSAQGVLRFSSERLHTLGDQTLTFLLRGLQQQLHEWRYFVFDISLLLIMGAVTGLCVGSPETQFQLATLVIGLTATISALRIFGPERAVFIREAHTGVSAVAYFLGKALSWTPRILVSPLAFLYFYMPAAYPCNTLTSLYTILLLAELTCSTLGVLVSLLVDQKSSQVAAVMACLISTLFAGTQPTAASMAVSPAGRFVMLLSYSRWTDGALATAFVQCLPPVMLHTALDRTNYLGYSNVNWTTVGNAYPEREYDELNGETLHCLGMLILQFATCSAACVLLLALASSKGSGSWSGVSELLETGFETLVERCCHRDRLQRRASNVATHRARLQKSTSKDDL